MFIFLDILLNFYLNNAKIIFLFAKLSKINFINLQANLRIKVYNKLIRIKKLKIKNYGKPKN